MIGITRFIDSFFEPFDAVKIAKKCSEGSNPKYAGKCPVEIALIWYKEAWKGTKIHEQIQKYIANEECNLSPYITDFVDNLLVDYNILHTEFKVENEEYGLRGIVDIILQHKVTKKLLIGDWKTNEKIDTWNKFRNGNGCLNHLTDCKLNHYSLQLNLYKLLLQDIYNVEDCELQLFHIQKTKVKEIEVEDMEPEIGYMLFERGLFFS